MLSSSLPPLILGTATFNSQYNPDPYALPTTALIHAALASGISAFDTSPYYGPAESLLGRALDTDYVRANFPRSSYTLLTKVGRISGSSFDYSPPSIRRSIRRSLARLHTDYLDVVYCHDVEFVSPAEVLVAVHELRRIRDEENTIRYIGISGYPVDRLADLAELVKAHTGAPLDAVMSYAHFTIQNTTLVSRALPRLLAAGVDVVPNASPLGMGLLRRGGVPVGAMGDFHPAPCGLRRAVHEAAEWVERKHGKKLEMVAVRFALEEWIREGKEAGVWCTLKPDTTPGKRERFGVSVVGVSNAQELSETLRVWRSILAALGSGDGDGDSLVSSNRDTPAEETSTNPTWSRRQREHILSLVRSVQAILGPQWVDYAWPSPPPGFVNSLPAEHVAAL